MSCPGAGRGSPARRRGMRVEVVPWSSFAVANGAIHKFKSNPMTQRLRRLSAKSDLISELDSICLRTETKMLTGWTGIMLPLFYTVSKKATLPADRIYALLGFHPKNAIKPDYTKSPEEVYKSFVRLTIQSTNNLAFLSFNRFPKNLNLPSWIPDFSCEFKDDEYNITVPRGVYGADGILGHISLGGSPACALRPEDGPDELTVTGFVYDQPTYIARPWQAPPEERDSCLWQLAEEYEEALKVLEGRVSKESLHDALWRTLVWNATPMSTYPAPKEYGGEYVHVIKPRSILVDVNKMMAGIYDPAQHQRVIPIIGLAREYYESAVKHSLNRRFFITSKGHLGSGPIEMRADDLVCILLGYKTPVILRQRTSDDGFEWIGPAYVHGIMRRESLADRTIIGRTFKLK